LQKAVYSRAEWQQLVLFTWFWWKQPSSDKIYDFRKICEGVSEQRVQFCAAFVVHSIELLSTFFAEDNAPVSEPGYYTASSRPGFHKNPTIRF
jgi:hypothetical protein